MEFKLGATLWGRTAENRPPAQAQEAGSDFEKKLGLPARQSESPADWQRPAQQQAQEDSPQWQAAQQLLNQRKGAQAAAPSELYAWGSLAGHHLSHLPGLFQDSHGVDASLAAALIGVAPQAAAAMPGATQAATEPRTDSAADHSILAPGEQPVGAGQRRVTSNQAALGGFFAQHWPERRVLILPRESGAEVVIRDFHLSAVEQQSLARDLRDFMRNSGTQLQQIWVNGQCVWQQATGPTQLSTTKE